MNKKIYKTPKINFIEIKCEDVILSSGLNAQDNLNWSDKNYDGETWGEVK